MQWFFTRWPCPSFWQPFWLRFASTFNAQFDERGSSDSSGRSSHYCKNSFDLGDSGSARSFNLDSDEDDFLSPVHLYTSSICASTSHDTKFPESSLTRPDIVILLSLCTTLKRSYVYIGYSIACFVNCRRSCNLACPSCDYLDYVQNEMQTLAQQLTEVPEARANAIEKLQRMGAVEVTGSFHWPEVSIQEK